MDEFSQCIVSNTRKAARAVTRRYDAKLRPYGITSTQLSLLGALASGKDRTVSEIAEERGFERTTLTRNLDRLEALELISSRSSSHGNGRICELTSKGRAMGAELLPLWRQVQAEIQAELGADGFDATIATLRRLSEI
jgi:DNA-binding MarR family transcriptional regulator